MIIFAAMNSIFYSVRMHAERDSRHLSGAERLVPPEQVESVTTDLLQRALRLSPDTVSVSVDKILSEQIEFGAIPSIALMPQVGYEQGRKEAVAVLVEAGVTELSALRAMAAIANGASVAGCAMRGAMLIDASSGERLEKDHTRGVRATRLDLTTAASLSLTTLLQQYDLSHLRTREALVLAAKVLAAPSVVAELCWSDAADYTAGYVASQKTGYCRFAQLKPLGDLRGGRAFFVQPDADLTATIAFLEQTPFLADRHGTIRTLEGRE